MPGPLPSPETEALLEVVEFFQLSQSFDSGFAMSSNANGSLQSNGSDRNSSASQAGSNSTNGSSGNKQSGSADASNLTVDSTLSVSTSRSPYKSDDSNSSFENLSGSEIAEGSTFEGVMQALSRRHYNIHQAQDLPAETNCQRYFSKDYHTVTVVNKGCPNYPASLIIPVAVKENECEGPEVDFNKESYTELVDAAVHARIRSRYPVPAILFDNKFICRSGTLANRASAAYNQAMEAQVPATTAEPVSIVGSAVGTVGHIGKSIMTSVATIITNDLEELFKKDVEVLKLLKVDRVCDLMVEYAKCYKDVINVSSCEVLHKSIYRTIKNEDLPFPGCEFFTKYSEAGRNPEGLTFDYSQHEVTRSLVISEDLQRLIPDLKVDNLQDLEVVEITKNFLKIMLAFIIKDKGGMLVHCISGWDRTTLFISLLRLSLWADGVIHQSLGYEEIAYLTVTYDWYLFGHAFPNRWQKKEEIMHFCFNFLSYITTDEFSVTKMFKRLPAEERENRQFPDFEPGRREVLGKVRQYVLDAYKTHIIDCK